MKNNYLIRPNGKRLLLTATLSVLLVGTLQIPHLPVPALFLLLPLIPIILALPLFYFVPEFAQTGAHVEVWFAGVILKSPQAFVSVFAYYFVVVYLCSYRVGRRE